MTRHTWDGACTVDLLVLGCQHGILLLMKSRVASDLLMCMGCTTPLAAAVPAAQGEPTTRRQRCLRPPRQSCSVTGVGTLSLVKS